MSADTKKVRIRQIRSGIGCPREMRETLKALGLGRMHRIAERACGIRPMRRLRTA